MYELKSLFEWNRGVIISSEVLIDLGKIFYRLKYGKAHAAADDAVVMYDMTSGVQFDHENS